VCPGAAGQLGQFSKGVLLGPGLRLSADFNAYEKDALGPGSDAYVFLGDVPALL
jgi:hypothetical protein